MVRRGWWCHARWATAPAIVLPTFVPFSCLFRERAASLLRGVVTVAAVDADEHKSLGAQYDVKGFPTIKYIVETPTGKPKVVNYEGERSAQAIARWALEQSTRVVNNRLSGKKGGGKSAKSGGKSGGGDSFYEGTPVVVLDDSSFHKRLSESDAPFLVEFYAPWCGHCKALKPEFIAAADQLKGRVVLAAVDCTVSQQTCAEFGVQGYPTLKWFGVEDRDSPTEYQEGRTTADLVKFAQARWAATQPPPEAHEIADQYGWEKQCVGQEAGQAKQLCILAFLPHIMDSQAKGRNALLDILKEQAEHFKTRNFGFVWAEAGAQPGLEANFGVGGYGYPALVAFNPAKGKFSTLRVGFTAEGVREFLDAVRTGAERVEPISGSLAEAATTTPWDGQDVEVAEEEEFSLEELMGDDDKDEL